MAISRRKLRFRFRFGFGLAALAAVMLFAPAALASQNVKPKPKPTVTKTTSAADQYKPTVLTTRVTTTAARIGKCKVAVTRIYVPKRKACHGKKACLLRITKAENAKKKLCDRIGQPLKKS